MQMSIQMNNLDLISVS